MCSIGRIEAAGWCSSSEHPGSWHLHWLIQKRGSSRLLFQTRKIFSPPKGVGGCAVRISVVFLTPASWCLWKQGPESKGWSWTMRGWEPYEAPSDHWISVLIGNQSRSFHTRSASAPSSSGSPYHLCQWGTSDCIPGLHAEFCPCCSCLSHSFPSFSRVGLAFSWTQGLFIHAEDMSCFRTLEINIEEYRRAEIAPIV